MIVVWSLFLIWVVLNLVDVAVSWLGVQLGATEIGALYWTWGNWTSLAVNKMVFALLIGGVLVYIRRDDWLALLTLGMLGICIWNGWALLRQIGGI